METQNWYLELSEENGSHKFYEVTLENTDLTIRYGRIGDAGQAQKKTFETPEKARAEAEKKLAAKRKSGYQDAIVGERQKRAVQPKYPRIEVEQIEELFEPWRNKYTRPTWIPIIQDDDGAITDSKFSGIPFLSEVESIPTCGCCGKTLQLLLQLNLEQIPQDLQGQFGEGLIQVFYCTDQICEREGSNEQSYIWQAFSNRHFLRLISPHSSLSGSVQIPETYFPAKTILGWELQADVPSAQEWERYGIEIDYDFSDDFEARVSCPEFDISFSTDEEEIEEYVGEAITGDKFFGYPRWVQGIEYPTCPKCQTEMEFVFQIDSENNLPYMFGDAGIAHVTQCKEHKDILALAWACS
jgi:predicted DNA-binding WGR domain protein/uncharacterized protein YwqG